MKNSLIMPNIEKQPNILEKLCGIYKARLSKYVWSFFDIMHGAVIILFCIICDDQLGYYKGYYKFKEIINSALVFAVFWQFLGRSLILLIFT